MADWQILALMASFIGVLVAALLVMLSKILDFKGLEQSAKSELAFAASSVFLAIFLILVLNAATDAGRQVASSMYVYTYHSDYLVYNDPDTGQAVRLEPSTFLDSRNSLIELSILYMRSVMYCAEGLGRLAFWISLPAHWMSSISQDVFMAYPMSGWAWGGIAQSADNLLNTVYFMELIYRLLIYVLKFMDVFSLTYMVPIGIVMRAFPPTRGAGAYIIAFGIGMYLVFPMAYMASVFSSPYPTICTSTDIPPPTMDGSSKASLMMGLSLWYRAFEFDILNILTTFSELSNALLTNLCLLPFLALTITMTFTQFSNGLLGANVPEIGRGLIKLI